jgi:hypothetical protein
MVEQQIGICWRAGRSYAYVPIDGIRSGQKNEIESMLNVKERSRQHAGRYVLLMLVLSTSLAAPAYAWIYPEHRDISLLAVQKLDPDRTLVFSQLWREARRTFEHRLCSDGADAAQGLTPECIDWAALPAIAGDHACSSQLMLETVTETDWILQLADVAAQLKVDLARIPILPPSDQLIHSGDLGEDVRERFAAESSRAERVNALRTADTRIQRIDVEYATRADAGHAHFLLARASTRQSSAEYADQTLRPGAQLNAIGVYSWFHLSALQKASRLASEPLSAEQRSRLARAVLFDEAFALHFLEDVFASGHVAGTWGDASQRKGTHDFYNQNGLETRTWRGKADSIVLMGDAHMRDEDAEVAANAVLTSLNQILDAATGRSEYGNPYRPGAQDTADNLNVCKSSVLPQREEGLQDNDDYTLAFTEALEPTPIPGLGPGLGSMPRFRSELGPFLGLSGMIDGRGISGGFESSQQSDAGFVGGLELALRGGIGLEGALGDSSDGLLFTSLGFRTDSPSTNSFGESRLGSLDGNLSAAIPARSALAFRLRMPFYVLPADLLFLSPMYFFNKETYTRMAVTSVNGGLLGWQQGVATPFGRIQFVLGRELGINFYGLDGEDQLVAAATEPGSTGRIVKFESTAFEMPIFEFRPYRSFSMNQSSSIIFQFYGGADVPHSSKVTIPAGAEPVDLDTIWYVGVRMAFDWRYYF